MITAEKARELLDEATPGPWWWRNTADVYLQGAKTRIVLAFARRGMNSAQPMFKRPGDALVLDKVADKNINDYADARLIASAPDLAETVIAQAEQLERVRALADKWEHGALRWADPLPVPPAVGQLREALDGAE